MAAISGMKQMRRCISFSTKDQQHFWHCMPNVFVTLADVDHQQVLVLLLVRTRPFEPL